MTRIILIFLGVILFLSSCNNDHSIVHRKDYEKFLSGAAINSPLQKIDHEIGFWNARFATTPDDLIARSKIAALLTRRFTYSGEIEEIIQADSILKLVNSINRINSSSTYRSLAANCITQHQFRLAQKYIDSALALGDDKYLSVLMEVDVALELGNTMRARHALNSLQDKNAFEYIIREAKYKDHVEGNLAEAIKLMELALVKTNDIPNTDIKLWTKSNLGDMYGHANRFAESYKSYLEVLEQDPTYYHALKGIAWLAYSKDNNYGDAKEILRFLSSKHPVPDYDLLMATIAESENDASAKDKLLTKFEKRVSAFKYGNMYNKYRFSLQADEWNNKSIALEIAKNEVELRPTAEAFSWLAWAYLINDQKELALETIKYHVENKCFEPDALYYAGRIFMANNQNEKARKYLHLAKESAFELGPVLNTKITISLSQL